MSNKKISRHTLKKYAQTLGQYSLAAAALKHYDYAMDQGLAPEIFMYSSGFEIQTSDYGRVRYG